MSDLPEHIVVEGEPRRVERRDDASLAWVDWSWLHLNPRGGWDGQFAVALRWPGRFNAIVFWFRPMCFGLELGPLRMRFYSRRHQERTYSWKGQRLYVNWVWGSFFV